MKNLIFELAKVDRRAVLIFNREIKLRIKRGELELEHLPNKLKRRKIKNILHLIDSFDWDKTRQGWKYWSDILELTYTKAGRI